MKQNFRKNKIVTDKAPFFVIDLVCTPYSISYDSASDRAVLFALRLLRFQS